MPELKNTIGNHSGDGQYVMYRDTGEIYGDVEVWMDKQSCLRVANEVLEIGSSRVISVTLAPYDGRPGNVLATVRIRVQLEVIGVERV